MQEVPETGSKHELAERRGVPSFPFAPDFSGGFLDLVKGKKREREDGIQFSKPKLAGENSDVAGKTLRSSICSKTKQGPC